MLVGKKCREKQKPLKTQTNQPPKNLKHRLLITNTLNRHQFFRSFSKIYSPKVLHTRRQPRSSTLSLSCTNLKQFESIKTRHMVQSTLYPDLSLRKFPDSNNCFKSKVQLSQIFKPFNFKEKNFLISLSKCNGFRELVNQVW